MQILQGIYYVYIITGVIIQLENSILLFRMYNEVFKKKFILFNTLLSLKILCNFLKIVVWSISKQIVLILKITSDLLPASI